MFGIKIAIITDANISYFYYAAAKMPILLMAGKISQKLQS